MMNNMVKIPIAGTPVETGSGSEGNMRGGAYTTVTLKTARYVPWLIPVLACETTTFRAV